MGYQWAILAVFIMFALLEAKNGKLFKKATEVSDDGKVELIGREYLQGKIILE